MPEAHDHHANARNLAVDILRKEMKRTPELIRATAEKAVQAATIFAPEAIIDVEALTLELRHLFSVGVEDATVLDDHDPKGHVPWLPNMRANNAPGFWRFWTRYMTYLERDLGWPPDVVNNLHELTEMILERLEEPTRDGPWDRRGMVVGSVQSGKTANYIGLINKAVDAGYKLVIVLAGIHSNLRSQTQLRVDEGVLGFDTQKSRKLNLNGQWVGVGKLPGDKLVIHSLTSSAEKGDFSKPVAESIGVMIGGDPVVLVVKKNSKLLGNLLKWVRHVAATEESGGNIIPNIPLLLIDDEADNASINVKDRKGTDGDADSVSAINGKIREILSTFEKSAYVGYTATPFANIFVNPSAQTEKHGEDIFPRSFIINVKPPSNYVGPGKVFGLDGDADAGILAQDGLPIVRQIDDHADPTAFPPRHKKDHVPGELPPSLKRAIRCFILSCAARRARGHGKKHNSMLVHVTRFVDVQNHVVRLVRDEAIALQRRIEFGDGNRKPTVRDELCELWETEFVPVSKALGEEAGSAVTWAQVDAELHGAASKVVILPINGFAKEALDYKEHEAEGRNVIAVGGDKLSRGLTLEGLSISYFLRTSRMYDTLMQMGRWFGYRPGYLDLCRLFTTGLLTAWYRHIALADAELRREFDYMVVSGQTPEQYGLRVRTHPGGMTVTALNKMCHSQSLELSWAGVLVQSTQLPKDDRRVGANLQATESLLLALSAPEHRGGHETRIWRNVEAANVANFVEALQLPPQSARASGRQIATFIRQQAAKAEPELTCWTVALISVAQGRHMPIAGHDVGLVERSAEHQSGDSFGLRKANILSPADEGWDFEEQPFTQEWFDSIADKPELAADLAWLHGQIDNANARDVALELTRRWQQTVPPKLRVPANGETKRPNGRVLRLLRRRSHGLLLIYPVQPPTVVKGENNMPNAPTGMAEMGIPVIGVALSFPTSNTVLGVEYRVNRVWDAEIQEDSTYDD
jgi:hypothetical protein